MPQTKASADRFDVAIIGYGSTGATLANLLAKSGLSVAVIEREAELYHLPRAVHFDDEVMRVFQTVGIAQELSEKVHVNPGMRFVDPKGELLLDWPRPQEVGKHGWHTSYRLHQPDLEQLLRGKLSTYEHSKAYPNCKMTDLKETEYGVTISCLNNSDESIFKIEAGYVIGCDGAQSATRNIIGSQMEDFSFNERWLVIDVLLKKPRPDLGDHTIQYCNPKRPATYCRSPANRRRWEIALQPDETIEEMTKPSRVWEFLSDWIPPDDAKLERSTVYTFRSMLATKWRKGRVMIAGDAAHLTPPFMGQGMCTGIRDAANLAWKLAAVIKGHSDQSLLDTYQVERSPHARSYITTAIKLGKLINSLDKESARALASEDGRARMASITPVLGDADIADNDLPPSPLRGQIFGQPLLGSGQLMDDLIGYAPVLLVRSNPAFNDNLDVKVLDAETEPAIGKMLDEHNVDAVLLRPDRYVLGTATGQNEIEILLKTAIALSSLAA